MLSFITTFFNYYYNTNIGWIKTRHDMNLINNLKMRIVIKLPWRIMDRYVLIYYYHEYNWFKFVWAEIGDPFKYMYLYTIYLSIRMFWLQIRFFFAQFVLILHPKAKIINDIISDHPCICMQVFIVLFWRHLVWSF